MSSIFSRLFRVTVSTLSQVFDLLSSVAVSFGSQYVLHSDANRITSTSSRSLGFLTTIRRVVKNVLFTNSCISNVLF